MPMLEYGQMSMVALVPLADYLGHTTIRTASTSMAA